VKRREFLKRASVASLAAAAGKPADAVAAPAVRIIDPHVHVWTQDNRYPWAQTATTPPRPEALPEELLQLMRANGVSHTVLIQVIYYTWDNRFTRDTLKRFKGKFQGVCRVNPESPGAPHDLEKLVKQDGFRGVRLSPSGAAAGDWFRGPLMPPLWERTQQLKVPMTLLLPTSRLPDAARLIENYPALDVVIDHMADCPPDKPEELKKLLDLARFPRVYVKISHTWSLSKQKYPFRDTHDQVHKLYDAFGPQRLMWATDWPISERLCTYAQTLSVVRDEMKFLNQDDKHWILSKTIERIWPFS
jgi:predicted TIM-barrel fold metal-dependent hydrolase